MSNEVLYLKAAAQLRKNPRQWAAYNSTGHCILLAGPGSGKTKTLTIKLARILAEDVQEPRGIACITYNNECVRELEHRLVDLGVEAGRRVFIGTVHSFSLTQIVLPYAKCAGLDLPGDFRVANRTQQRHALEHAYVLAINGPEDPGGWRLPMERYRRTHLNRDSQRWRDDDPVLAKLVVAYEDALRSKGLIDFDDMPLLAYRALQENVWLRQAILAKFPVLVVDEYQDLGHALHEMVLELCFGTGIRLFAVGDPDQSIYGFTGADPDLLRTLSERNEVESIRLRLNYRSGSRIVTASQYALGEPRDYEAHEDAEEGLIFFHPLGGSYDDHAEYLFGTIVPEAFERIDELTRDQIAILYPAAYIGDAVEVAAHRHGYGLIRTDQKALYPRFSRVLRWLELCAVWCCEGWRRGDPRFMKLVAEGTRIFSEALVSEEDRLEFQQDLIEVLWEQRDASINLYVWLLAIRNELLVEMFKKSRTLVDEEEALTGFLKKTSPDGSASALTLGDFSGLGKGSHQINLSTLHSAKSREFKLVIMFGVDQGRIPWNNQPASRLAEWRRLFYVGFTRAERELHIVHTKGNPSRFVREVQQRLQEET